MSNLITPKKELFYPLAKQWPKSMTTRGNYRKGYPEGAIVHFTAGHWGMSALDSGISSGYAYLLLDCDGKFYQANPLNRWGYHAGVSSWKGLGSGVSEYLVGIEITAAGKVTKVGDKYQTWFKTMLPEDQVRYVENKDNVQKGYYHKYTKEQETSLIQFLLWMKTNNPDIFSFDLVLGHDEVAPTRKNDPGGALSCTMPELRHKLTSLYLEQNKSPSQIMADAYKNLDIEFPILKVVTLAQWLLESKNGNTDLFTLYKNAGNLKWRGNLGEIDAMSVRLNNENYASFNTWEGFFRYYWKFIERPVYSGWRASFKTSPIGFIEHLLKCGYSQEGGYVQKVQTLFPMAEKLLKV